MKNIIIIAAMLISFSASAQFKSANLTAAGLTCAMCTRAINIALDKLPFIESVKPDIKTSCFDISFRPGSTINFDAMKKAVEDAGFSISRLAVKTNFKNVSVNNDSHVKLGDKTLHFLKVPAATMNGEKSVLIVDKDFLSAKEYKKYAAATTMTCVQTGKAASCCTGSGIPSGTRIYHVTI